MGYLELAKKILEGKKIETSEAQKQPCQTEKCVKCGNAPAVSAYGVIAGEPRRAYFCKTCMAYKVDKADTFTPETPVCACCGGDLSNATPWTGRRWCYGLTNDGYRWNWFCTACRPLN